MADVEDAADVVVKRRAHAPPGFFEVEAAGLAWLAAAEAAGGVPVVAVRLVSPAQIVLDRVPTTAPTPGAVAQLGRRLARTHATDAPWWGAPPAGCHGDGFIGDAPLPLVSTPPPASDDSWGAFYAEHRVLPYLRGAVDTGAVGPTGARVVDRVVGRLRDGDLDHPQPALVRGAAARLHGDLWSGNVLFRRITPATHTPDPLPAGSRDDGMRDDGMRDDGVRDDVEAVLIDPAAHGGHAETDLAMLALFGMPYLDRLLGAYAEISPLADGWRDRVALHQLHPLLVHAVLFGGGYGAQAVDVARRYA